MEGDGLLVVGGQQQHLVLVGGDGRPHQVLSVDQTLVQLEHGLVRAGAHPGHRLAVRGAQAGDVAGEGVPQLHLHLGEAGGQLGPRRLSAQLVLAVVSPRVNFPRGRKSYGVITAGCDFDHLLIDHQHLRVNVVLVRINNNIQYLGLSISCRIPKY